MIVSTGFKGSHSAEKFAFGHTKVSAESASEISRHSETGRSQKKYLLKKIPSGAVNKNVHHEGQGDPAHNVGCLAESRTPSWGLIMRLGRGLLSAVPS